MKKKTSKKNYDTLALAMHKRFQGKIGTKILASVKDREGLAVAYTPGVAAVSRAIAKDKKLARSLTMQGRTVAIVSDGSAVLGLGNIGPEAALPVMEGKAMLFKQFANIDAVPIVLNTQDTKEIIAAVEVIAPTFGGINLEDISAPRCFEIERELIKRLSIPVMHDDQHGTAVVVLAALYNALKATGKKLVDARIVINGAGAAAVATTTLLIDAGVPAKHITVLDSKGILHSKRVGLSPVKKALAMKTNGEKRSGTLEDALEGADVFIGMSKGDVLNPKWIATMAEDPIIFAMANPTPEIAYEKAIKTKAAIVGTGRSDHPNQINNVLAFPGIFKGALEAHARDITTPMKLAAAKAIARLVSPRELRGGAVIPDPFDKRVAPTVARAVKNTS